MINDRFYLICCAYDQRFNTRKVEVIKALRTMFSMSLKDAKDFADNYLCLSTECGQIARNITFRCSEAQTALAMCALMTGSDALWGRLKDDDGEVFSMKIFDFQWIEPASDRGILPIYQYGVR